MTNSKARSRKHSTANKPLPKSTRSGAIDEPFIAANKATVVSHDVSSPVARTRQEHIGAGMHFGTPSKTLLPMASRPKPRAIASGLLLGALGGAILHPDGVLVATIGAIVGAGLGALSTVERFVMGPSATLLSRVVLGLIFIVTGFSKELSVNSFAGEISAYKMVPDVLIHPMALVLPLIEMLVGVYLLLGLMTKWAALVSGVLTLVFIIAVGMAMAHGLAIDCGCFGSALGLGQLQETVGWPKIWQDVGLLVLAIHLFFVKTIFSFDSARKK